MAPLTTTVTTLLVLLAGGLVSPGAAPAEASTDPIVLTPVNEIVAGDDFAPPIDTYNDGWGVASWRNDGTAPLTGWSVTLDSAPLFDSGGTVKVKVNGVETKQFSAEDCVFDNTNGTTTCSDPTAVIEPNATLTIALPIVAPPSSPPHDVEPAPHYLKKSTATLRTMGASAAATFTHVQNAGYAPSVAGVGVAEGKATVYVPTGMYKTVCLYDDTGVEVACEFGGRQGHAAIEIGEEYIGQEMTVRRIDGWGPSLGATVYIVDVPIVDARIAGAATVTSLLALATLLLFRRKAA